MSKPILAVGIDPAKRVHRAVGVLFPDEVVFDGELPNALDAIQSLDLRLAELAATHAAELVYGLEDHRRYGRLLCQVLTERGRDVRVVNPLWTNRQRAFYGQDKDDAIDGRSIAAVVLRRRDSCLWPTTSASWLRRFVKPSEPLRISARSAPSWSIDCTFS
jgi:transposase